MQYSIPPYRVNIDDLISLRGKSRENDLFVESFQSAVLNLDYLEKDIENFSGKLSKQPRREAIPVEVIDSSIIEFHSKN